MIKGLCNYTKEVTIQKIKTKNCTVEVETAYKNNKFAVAINYMTTMHGIAVPLGTWSRWHETEKKALEEEAERQIKRLSEMSKRDTLISRDNKELIKIIYDLIEIKQPELF